VIKKDPATWKTPRRWRPGGGRSIRIVNSVSSPWNVTKMPDHSFAVKQSTVYYRPHLKATRYCILISC
jgi:hypothetical protein